jgi:hypothetical protein
VVVALVVVPVAVVLVGDPLVTVVLGSHAAGSVKSFASVAGVVELVVEVEGVLVVVDGVVVVVVVKGVVVVVVGTVWALAAPAASANRLAAYTADRSVRNMPQ